MMVKILKRLFKKVLCVNCVRWWAYLGAFWFVTFALNPLIFEELMFTLLTVSYLFGWILAFISGLKGLNFLYIKVLSSRGTDDWSGREGGTEGGEKS